MHSPIAATALLEAIPRKPIPPKAAARFAARAFCALLRFPTRIVRKPQAAVALATIEPASVEALAAQHSDLDLDHVEPTCVLGGVMELQPSQDAPCLAMQIQAGWNFRKG